MNLNYAELTSSGFVRPKSVHSDDGKVQLHDTGISIENPEGNQLPSLALTIDLPPSSAFNQIIWKSPASVFITVFCADDSEFWERVPVLKEYREGDNQILELPFIHTQKIQLVFHRGSAGNISSLKINELQISRNFKIKLEASSSYDRLWTVENLIDNRDEYGWCSRALPDADTPGEKIEIELSQPAFLGQVALRSIFEQNPRFPRSFVVSASLDKSLWTDIIREANFQAAPLNWYRWTFMALRARFLRITIHQAGFSSSKEFTSAIQALKIYAVPENILIYNSHGNSPASELIPGTVTLSENRGSAPGKVVQANDSRLKKATSESEGIVRFARDNESSENAAVQGNDSRIKAATETLPGIVRLARDGENLEHTSVQGNDSRLKRATTAGAGIVQLADSGQIAAGLVVQSDDIRLKPASETDFGLAKLAPDNTTKNGTVVQANDSRLKKADIAWPGIVQLAAHGEAQPLKAVQADDPRLIIGSEEQAGRIQFARDKENAASKAVQGNDSRLQPASEAEYGIVRIAGNGKNISGAVVDASDSRLSDAREPLPHEHDYAPKNHAFGDHSGVLFVKIDETVSAPQGFSIPPYSGVPIQAENQSGIAMSVDGGIVATSNGQPSLTAIHQSGLAIDARSKSFAMRIFSESEFALTLPLSVDNLKGSGKSISAAGRAEFSGGVYLENKNLVIAFDRVANETFLPGDLVSVDTSGNLIKTKNTETAIVGVVVDKAGISLGFDGKVFVAVAGNVKIRVSGNVQAGSRLAFVKGNPGTASVVSSGGVFVALDTDNSSGERLVSALFIK